MRDPSEDSPKPFLSVAVWPTAGPPGPKLRAAVAAVVHAAVCEARPGGGGYGRCADYAVAGAVLCSALSGRRYVPQAGGLEVYAVAGPPREYFYICGEDNGLARGEFHAWVCAPGAAAPGRPGLYCAAEWVDFSSRHYRSLYERTLVVSRVIQEDAAGAVLALDTRPRPAWTAPPPPDYVWHAGQTPPGEYRFYPDDASNRSLQDAVKADPDGHFHRLAAALGRHARTAFRLNPGAER